MDLIVRPITLFKHFVSGTGGQTTDHPLISIGLESLYRIIRAGNYLGVHYDLPPFHLYLNFRPYCDRIAFYWIRTKKYSDTNYLPHNVVFL